MRLRNVNSGVVVSVPDDHPAVADPEWEPAEEPEPKRRTTKKAE